MRACHIVKYGWFKSSPEDILRSVDIGVRFVTATATPKLRLTGAVFLLAVATAGGICGWYYADRQSLSPRRPVWICIPETAATARKPRSAERLVALARSPVRGCHGDLQWRR